MRSRALAWPLLAALLLAALFAGAAWRIAGTLAFPLDDSWIHQGYARTLAQQGEWAFLPGQPSSGSTAPLWTVLLVPGHWLGHPIAWSHALGLLCWAAVIALGARLSALLFEDAGLARWTALALAAEWHLAWAALSGMEILLYTALALALMALLLERRGPPLLWGIVGGLLTLARPEGLGLLGLLGLAWLWAARHAPRRALRGAAAIGLGWLLLVAPVLLFNWQVSGTPFPNTFYAKQQEYALLLAALNPAQRLAQVAWQPWIGGQALLLLALPWLPWRRLATWRTLPALWALSLVLLYALRLPVTYQHGRYMMPLVPIVLIYGLAGGAALLRRLPRLLRRPLAAALLVAFALFWPLGAAAFGEDVAIIECEMGTTARWLSQNSAASDLLAVHDIGRIGFETQRPLLDMAGLLSPETIPILRNDQALVDLAERRGARYVVTFADWYPTLPQDARLSVRHASACPWTKAAGQEPMTVYELR